LTAAGESYGGQAVSDFFAFCLIYALESVGFAVFRFLKISNPALLGAMLASGALNTAGYYPRLSMRLVSFASKHRKTSTIGCYT
jgi:uncharacterized membrane protein AbrB (regulator of aidB expression)